MLDTLNVTRQVLPLPDLSYPSYTVDNGSGGYNYSENSPNEEFVNLPVYVTVYVTIVNIIIFLVGVFGNVLVIVVVARVKDMRTTMNLYLVNLSVADLLVLLVCQPSAMLQFYSKDIWYLGAVACKLIPVLEHSVTNASILTILVISCERYHAICRPLKTFLLCNRPRPALVMLLVWGVAIVTSLPFLFMTHLTKASFYDDSIVEVCVSRIEKTWHYWYIGFINFTFFLFPMLLLIAMYGRIIIQMYHHRDLSSHVHGESSASTGYNLRSRRQVIRMLIAIIILFFVALAPLRITFIWLVFSPKEPRPELGIEVYYNLLWIGRMLVYINSAGNPIIYSLLSSNFKKAFTLLLQGRVNTASSSVAYTGYTGAMGQRAVSVALQRMSLPAIGTFGTQHENGRFHHDSPAFHYTTTRYSITTM